MERVKQSFQTSYQLGRRHARRIHRHPAGLPVVMFVALIGLSCIGIIIGMRRGVPQLTVKPHQNYIVIVSHDGITQTVPTNEKTVGALVRQLHVPIGKYDRVEPASDTAIVQDNLLVNIYRAVPVAIVDGAEQIIVPTAAATPRSKITQSGKVLYAEDVVQVKPVKNFVTVGSLTEQVVIERATPISMDLYGKQVMVRTQAKTVAQLLQEKQIIPTKDDTVKPNIATRLTAGMRVSVVRDGIQVITVDETVAPPEQTVMDSSLSFGSQAVRQEGSPGKVTKTYQITIQKGDEVSRKLLQTVTVVAPVPRIVAKGKTVNVPPDRQAVMAAAGVNSDDYMYVDYIFSHESGWNAAAMSSNGYAGLGQTRPATLSASCPNWQNDPVCQTQFFSRYAGRYGGWAGAYAAWQRQHWW
jgi:uncharacterized protein YabE (DUF348 family)